MTATDRHTLIFSKPTTAAHKPFNLPPNITRYFIPTLLGTLELLAADPTNASPSPSYPRKKAILFQHGGFGSASVFLPFLNYYSQSQHPAYALSLRGHGSSWTPSFLRMVWGYSRSDFGADLQAGVRFVQDLEAEKRGVSVGDLEGELVLVGHSAGGGLVQQVLSDGLVRVGGLVCLAAFPGSGGWRCYWNWFKLDPFFVPRYHFRDFCHPRSPLSSTSLVHQAFFCPSYPISEVRTFEAGIPEYESMTWPLGMMFRFVDVGMVLRGIVGWGKGAKRMLVVAGDKDVLMDPGIMRKLAAEYRVAVSREWEGLVGDGESDMGDGMKSAAPGEESRVGFEVVMGSGHHLQNDLYWEDCARKILEFVEQL